ncbi:hypothetical protein Aperf_G00000040648 [Anoplocephala perfoliata]
MSLTSEFQSVLEKGIEAVLPDRLIDKWINFVPDGIQVGGVTHPVTGELNIFGFGKAALGLVKTAVKILGSRVNFVVCCTPQSSEKEKEEFPDLFKENIVSNDNPKLKFYIFHGSRTNEPNENVVSASLKMAEIASKMRTGDLLLVCITGGGSALLTLPAPLDPAVSPTDEAVDRLRLDDIKETTKLLSLNGATIQEINTVRSCLDCMKAGGLANFAAPAKVVSLILSDVIGDPIRFIASGPTYVETDPKLDVSKFDKAVAILNKRELIDKIPTEVKKFLLVRQRINLNPTVLEPMPTNCLIGSLSIALEAAAKEAAKMSPCCLVTNSIVLPMDVFRRTPLESFECILPIIVTDKLDGDMTQRAEAVADLSWELRRLTQVFLRRPDCTSRHVTKAIRDRLKNAQERLAGKMYYRDLIHACYQVAKAATEHIATGHIPPGRFLSGICLLFGGEATVKVSAMSDSSHGGRCSHAALVTALRLYEIRANSKPRPPPSPAASIHISFFARASDGLDGPTAFGAGAWSTEELIENAAEAARAKKYLSVGNSYGFFEESGRIGAEKGYYLPARLTGTNVMDLFMCLIGIYA